MLQQDDKMFASTLQQLLKVDYCKKLSVKHARFTDTLRVVECSRGPPDRRPKWCFFARIKRRDNL
jgi:hypothetical protein